MLWRGKKTAKVNLNEMYKCKCKAKSYQELPKSNVSFLKKTFWNLTWIPFQKKCSRSLTVVCCVCHHSMTEYDHRSRNGLTFAVISNQCPGGRAPLKQMALHMLSLTLNGLPSDLIWAQPRAQSSGPANDSFLMDRHPCLVLPANPAYPTVYLYE